MRNLDKYETDYLSQPYEHFQRKFRREKVLNLLSKYFLGNKKLLEVGTGMEAFFSEIDEFELLTVIEPGTQFYKKAQTLKNTHRLKNKIEVFNLSLESAKKRISKKYDVIIISCLLHEIEDQHYFLNCLKHYMHENSIVHIDVPNAHSFHRLLASEMGVIKSVYEKSESQYKFQQNDIFSKDSLIDLINNVGFEVIDIGTFIIKPFTHDQMQRLVDIGFLNDKILIGLKNMDKYFKDQGSEIYCHFKIKS